MNAEILQFSTSLPGFTAIPPKSRNIFGYDDFKFFRAGCDK
jgi:hypothetical protein